MKKLGKKSLMEQGTFVAYALLKPCTAKNTIQLKAISMHITVI